MQLDKTRIAIRERDFTDILDLSLQLIRTHFAPWLAASAVGVAPFALLNWWLVKHVHLAVDVSAPWLNYTLIMIALVGLEAPLAGAFATRYFGHALFVDRPPARIVMNDVSRSVWQLLMLEVVARGLFFLPAFVLPPGWGLFMLFALGWIPFVYFPFLGEIILLERNPLIRRRSQPSSWQRSQAFHKGARGDQFGRAALSLAIGGAMTAGFSLGLWYIRGTFSNRWDLGLLFFTYLFPAGLWLVISFFTVVRYLSYLDLRIRREGWEVELLMRAEAARLARQAL